MTASVTEQEGLTSQSYCRSHRAWAAQQDDIGRVVQTMCVGEMKSLKWRRCVVDREQKLG